MLRVVLITLTLLVSAVAGGVGAPAPAEAMTAEVTFEDVAAIPSLTDVHARVFRLYWAFFDRQPDADGALYWANQNNQCWSLERIADFFATSDEFVATYGTLTDAEFVDLIYRNVLNRPAEPAGRVFWEGEIASGDRSRVQVMLDFAYADEFVANHPLPSDGKTDQPCDEDAPDLPEPSSANAVLASSLPNAIIPADTCSSINPGNNVLVNGRTATNPDGTWAELATGTDHIATLFLDNLPRRAFADITGDGNVDAVVGIHCRSIAGTFDQIVPVLFVHGEAPVRLIYSAGAGLTSGEEPVGVRAILARQDRIVFSWAATLNLTSGTFSWEDDPCCPSIEFLTEVVAGPAPGVTHLDRYTPITAAVDILDGYTAGDRFVPDVDVVTDGMLREWLPAGSTYTNFDCLFVATNIIRCGLLASTGPALQFDLGQHVNGRWVTSNPMGFI